MSEFESPRHKFQRSFGIGKQLWVVGYINSSLEDSIRDLDICIEAKADAIVFEGKDYQKIDQYLAALKEHAPHFKMGINFLGSDDNLGTYSQTFELAKKHKLQIAWTDFSGVDQIEEMKDLNLHLIEELRDDYFFYVSGIHMKYSTLRDPNKSIHKSALQAMGWIDGIILTGLKTGVPADPQTVENVRQTIGDYPLGLASGVTSENIESFKKAIDFVLVNTGVAAENHRIDFEKLKKLRQVFS